MVARDFFGEIMTRTLQTCIGAAVLIVALGVAWLCYCASWSVLEWGEAGRAATVNLNKLGTAADGISKTTDALNWPCNTGKPCGALAKLDQTLNGVDTSIGLVNLVARHEQQQLGKLDLQEQTLFADTHKALTAGAGALAQAQADLQTAQGTIGALTEAVSEAKATEKDFHALVPDMKRLTKGMADTSEHTAVITDNTAKVTHHFEQEIDTPAKHHWWTPVKTIWGITWQALMLAK